MIVTHAFLPVIAVRVQRSLHQQKRSDMRRHDKNFEEFSLGDNSNGMLSAIFKLRNSESETVVAAIPRRIPHDEKSSCVLAPTVLMDCPANAQASR